MFLELNEDVEDYEDLTEIMSNVQLNSNFLALAREVLKHTHKHTHAEKYPGHEISVVHLFVHSIYRSFNLYRFIVRSIVLSIYLSIVLSIILLHYNNEKLQ